jgi:hypothetical protein
VTVEQMRVQRWEDPPPTGKPWAGGRRPGSRFDAIADELRDETGRWGVIFAGARNVAHGIASAIAQAKTRCFQPLGSFQVATRTRNGITTVYVRYIGERQ